MKRRHTKKMNKKITTLLMAGVLATATLGVGYAQWNQELTLHAEISLGQVSLSNIEEANIDSHFNFKSKFKNESDMALNIDPRKPVELVVELLGKEYSYTPEYVQFYPSQHQAILIDSEVQIVIPGDEVIKAYVTSILDNLGDIGMQMSEDEKVGGSIPLTTLKMRVHFRQANLADGGWTEEVESSEIAIRSMHNNQIGLTNEWSGSQVIPFDWIQYETIVREIANELAVNQTVVDAILGIEVPPIMVVPDEPAVPGGELPPMAVEPEEPAVPGGELPPMEVEPEEPAAPEGMLPPMEVESGEVGSLDEVSEESLMREYNDGSNQ